MPLIQSINEGSFNYFTGDRHNVNTQKHDQTHLHCFIKLKNIVLFVPSAYICRHSIKTIIYYTVIYTYG